MRVLVLSSTPWADENSFGSSFSNIFGGIQGLEFANIYCQHGAPDNVLVSRYLQITERSLLTNMLRPSIPPGRTFRGCVSSSGVVCGDGDGPDRQAQPIALTWAGQKAWDFFRTSRLQIFFWARDLIWRIGRWDSPQLKAFVSDFAPDLIFQPIYYSNSMSDMALSVHSQADVPMVGYISDDNYTLRQFSVSPLYWIDRLSKRRKVRRVVEACEFIYVISDLQRKEYEECFKKRCEVLTKCADFSAEAATVIESARRTPCEPIQLVYTGNIGGGRWRSLALIASVLRELNSSAPHAELTIYTSTPVTASMRRQLDVPGSSKIAGSVPAHEISQLQADADVLVHVEGLDLASRLRVHQSFSTKIVDYLTHARCIFAVGPADVASIDYFVTNDSAIVARTPDEVRAQLQALVTDASLLEEYGRKAWECGKRNHNKDIVQRRLYADLRAVIAAYRDERS